MDKKGHWQRAESLADSIRRYLIAIHTGGIGVTFVVASSMVDDKVSPAWAWKPGACFAGGLVLVLVSLFLAKMRAIERSKAENPDEVIFKFYEGSLMWDVVSSLAFVAGAAAGLIQISEIALKPCQ